MDKMIDALADWVAEQVVTFLATLGAILRGGR